jgi:hypothetical protein
MSGQLGLFVVPISKRRSRLPIVALLALSALLLLPSFASATVLESMTVEDMSQRAVTIVEGTVLSVKTENAADGVRTAVTIGIAESLKGGGGTQKTVYVPGGILPDGSRVVVDGMAAFIPGEQCYVFADKNDWVIGGMQGKVAVASSAGSAKAGAEPAALVDRRVKSALGISTPMQEVLKTAEPNSESMSITIPKTESDALKSQSAEMLDIGGSSWLSDGFESGSLAGWTAGGTDDWGITTYRARTGAHSLYSGGSSGGGNYANNSDFYLIRGPYNLSTATGQTRLAADLWLDTEADYDKAGLFVSPNGINFDGTVWWGEYPYWRTVSLDLANVAGTDGILHDYSRATNVWVGLWFQSDDTVNNYEGAYLDNVALEDYGTPAITAITPNEAPAGVDSHVTISGTGFGNTVGDIWFPYGRKGVMEIPASDILSWTNTSINCAVPTGVIDDYSASAGSGNVVVTNAAGLDSNAIPFSTPFGYGAHRWMNWGTGYYLNPAGTSVAAREAAVDAAAASWNAAGSGFRFSDLGLSSTEPTRNYVNEVTWANGMPDGVIGTAWSWWDASGDMTESDIKFSNTFSWGDGSPGSGTMDVQSIAAHELGHWLRLLDQYASGDSSKIMYGIGAYNQRKRMLSAGDTLGIRWLYPAIAPSVTKSPTPSTLTYRRKKGVARWTLAAMLRWPGGAAQPGQRVYLQSSANGRTKWKTLYRLTTNSGGKVSRTLSSKKRATTYYRWYVQPSPRTAATIVGKQKIVVK